MRISELIAHLEEIKEVHGDLELVGDTWDMKYLSGCVEYVGGEMRCKLTFSDHLSQCYFHADMDEKEEKDGMD